MTFFLNFGRSVYRAELQYSFGLILVYSDYFNLFINLVIGVIIGKLEIESYQNERIGVSQIRDTGKKTEKSENWYQFSGYLHQSS